MRCFHSQINFKCKVLSKTQVTRLCAFYILFIMIICTLKIASPRTPGAVTAPPPTAAAVGVAVSTQVTGELFQLEVALGKQPSPHGGGSGFHYWRC